MSNKNADHYFLRGGGEMGELIRTKDWGETALGDPSNWPQSLCTMVAVMLDNPFGMYIAWGSEYIQLYNDGYRPILGATKHPHALGISTRETFSEIWHIIGSMFDGVMKGKAVGFPDLMLPLNRNGFVEKCYFDFSYSPIRKDNGEVGGVLVTVIETTEKKKITEELKESNARYINNIMQAPVAMCIFRGKNYVVEIANEKMLAIWGKEAEQVMNKPIFEGLAEAKDQGLEVLLENVYITGEKFVANERPVKLPRNGKMETTYVNFVYDALKEANGTISGIVAIAVEVTPQVVARSKVEESEQKVRALVENAPFPIAVYVGKEMIVELANQSIIDIWGKGNDVIGKSFKKVLPELDNQLVFEQIEKVLTTGESFNTKNTPLDLIVDGELSTYYFNYSFTPLYDTAGSIYGVMNTGVDLTDLNIARRKIEESEQNLRSMVLQSPIGICVIDADTLVSEIVNDSFIEIAGKPFEEIAGKHYWDSFAEARLYYESALNKVIEEGEPFYANEAEMMLIRNGKKEVIYVTFVYAPLKNIEGIVKNVAVWVLDNTSQVITRRKIEEADKRFRDTVKQAPVGISILRGPQYIVEMANDTYLQLVDRKENEFVNRPLFDSLPEVEQTVHSLLDGVVNTGMPYHGNEAAVPVNRYGAQEIYYFDFLYHPLKEEDGKISGVIAIVTEVTEKVKARKTIEERKRLYETITQNTPDLIYVFDLNYRFTYANEALLKMWGRTWEDSVGKGMLEVGYEPWHAEMHEHELDQVIATKNPFRGEVSFPHATLGERIYDYIFAPVIDQDGKVEAIAGTTRDITPQVEARKKIEEAEETARLAINSAELGVYEIIYSTDEMITDVRFKEIWGVDKSVTRNEYAAVIHPDDMLQREQAHEKAIRSGHLDYRARVIWKDKSIHWVRITGKVIYDSEGNPLKLIGIIQDITDAVNAREKIEESKEKLNIVIDASGLGTYELNLLTDEVIYSDKYLEIFGFGKGIAPTHKELINRLHPTETQMRNMAFKDSLVSGTLFYQAKVVWNDKTIHWIEVKGKVFYNEENKPVKLIGTVGDITEEKVQKQELQESESKFRLLADSMPQQIWTSDPQGNFNYYNQSVFDYSGLTPDQINKGGWIQIVHPDDREENIKQWVNAVTTGKDFLFEQRFRRYDGEYRWQLSSAIPQKDKDGNIQMWVGTSTDIQEQKTFTNELELQVRERTKEVEASNAELQKMNKELQSFAYISSHDMQEPLRKIQTFATLITEKEEHNLSPYGKDMFNRMQDAAKRMQTLIQDLLAYSRTNTTDRRFETTDLNEIIAQVKEDLKEELKEKHATIETNKLCHAAIIPFQFRQLMHNLIGNSLKFSDPNRAPLIKITSEIANGITLQHEKLSPQNKYCHITVADNGIGFEQQYSEKIFEVFQRLHGKNEYDGTGIGLSIVKKIVENHHGIITATGELNKGTTFDIFIPAT